MNRATLLLTSLILFVSTILILLISRVFTYNSTLPILQSMAPLYLVLINGAIFSFGIIFVLVSSKVGAWWYKTYYNAINGLNEKASVRLGFHIDDIFAHEAIIRRFTGVNFVIWMLRTFGLIISLVSSYYIYELIVNMTI